MPSADFCTAVRDPRGALSPYRTRCRSPGVSLTAFTAHLPNLQPGSAVDTGLRGPVPARPTQTASYSVPVRQVAALLPRFLQTAPRGHRPCASLALCLHQTWAEDLHLRAVKHARHTRRRGRTERAHRALENAARFPRASTGPFPLNHLRKTPKGPKIALENPDRPKKYAAATIVGESGHLSVEDGTLRFQTVGDHRDCHVKPDLVLIYQMFGARHWPTR